MPVTGQPLRAEGEKGVGTQRRRRDRGRRRCEQRGLLERRQQPLLHLLAVNLCACTLLHFVLMQDNASRRPEPPPWLLRLQGCHHHGQAALPLEPTRLLVIAATADFKREEEKRQQQPVMLLLLVTAGGASKPPAYGVEPPTCLTATTTSSRCTGTPTVDSSQLAEEEEGRRRGRSGEEEDDDEGEDAR